MERYRRAHVRSYDNQDKPDFKTKIIRQSIVCSAIFAVVFVIGVLKTDTAVNISDKIRESISYTVDYKETVRDIISSINNLTKGNDDDAPAKTEQTN